MSSSTDSGALSLLQPELLTSEELIKKIQLRCRMENLEKMSKEGLVEIFRRVILPLPQRFYRTNRRGKMLSSRRAKAGLERKRKEEGFSEGSTSKVSSSRLKPPPDISHPQKIRICSERKSEGESDLDKIKMKDVYLKERRKSEFEDGKDCRGRDSPSGKKITLKRPSDEKSSRPTTSPIESKRQRTPIKWP